MKVYLIELRSENNFLPWEDENKTNYYDVVAVSSSLQKAKKWIEENKHHVVDDEPKPYLAILEAELDGTNFGTDIQIVVSSIDI